LSARFLQLQLSRNGKKIPFQNSWNRVVIRITTGVNRLFLAVHPSRKLHKKFNRCQLLRYIADREVNAKKNINLLVAEVIILLPCVRMLTARYCFNISVSLSVCPSRCVISRMHKSSKLIISILWWYWHHSSFSSPPPLQNSKRNSFSGR